MLGAGDDLHGLVVQRLAALGGATLDTFASEPLAPGHPLPALDHVILTPQVAGVARQAAIRAATMAAHKVLDTLAGRAPPAGQRFG